MLHGAVARRALASALFVRSATAASDAVLNEAWESVLSHARAEPTIPDYAALLAAIDAFGIASSRVRNALPVRTGNV